MHGPRTVRADIGSVPPRCLSRPQDATRGGMAKQLRDGVDVEPSRERMRREGMASVVEAWERRGYVRGLRGSLERPLARKR